VAGLAVLEDEDEVVHVLVLFGRRRLGTLPSPPGCGPPAMYRLSSATMSQSFGVWHSPQWPGALARYAPRFHETGRAGSGEKSGCRKAIRFQRPTPRRASDASGTSASRGGDFTAGRLVR
jgi:hypothetical protein